MTVTEKIKASLFPTPYGWMGVALSPRGVCRVVLPRPALHEALKALGQGEADPQALSGLVQRLQRALLGEVVEFPDPLDLEEATPFQRQVWEAVRAIPPGETRSYGEIAQAIGCPRGARAVGRAVASNPLPLLIPCHRVVGKKGLGGYGGGLALKQALLEQEGRLKLPPHPFDP